jgi:hypothetical protein
VAEGLKRGARRHRSVALGVAAQFELTMRQADVIGVWERLGSAETVEAGAIVESGRIWRPGLRFEDFAAGQLDLETLKNAGRAVDIAKHAQHADINTTRKHYIVPSVETSCPVWQGSGGRIAKRKGAKGENGFYTEFDTVLHRSPLSIGRSAGI